MVWDPSFENAGTLAGDADGWAITVTDSNWRWARFGVKDWGIERFETDWGNEPFILYFLPAHLDPALFDPDNKMYEPFLYWGAGGTLLSYIASWDDVADDPAVFDTTPENYEDFEEDWNNEPFIPAFTSYIFGEKSETFTISAGQEMLGIKLEHPVNPDFDAVLTITVGSYTAASLVTELQTKVDAALVAAGGLFGAGDIVFALHPGDATKVCVYNNKSTYLMRLYSDPDDGWPDILGRELTLLDYRYYEADLLDAGAFPWVGEYNSATYYAEQFERDWMNSDINNPWDFRRTVDDWIDGTETIPAGGWIIQLGVNDSGSLHLRRWKTASVTSANLVIPAGTYTTAQLIIQINIAITAWLGGAGVPWNPGDIVADESPDGTIRLYNAAVISDAVFFVTNTIKTLWDYIGMPYDDATTEVEEYLHAETARFFYLHDLDPASFDVVPESWENFETDW